MQSAVLASDLAADFALLHQRSTGPASFETWNDRRPALVTLTRTFLAGRKGRSLAQSDKTDLKSIVRASLAHRIKEDWTLRAFTTSLWNASEACAYFG